MALGHLVMSCGNLVFIDLIEHLLTELGRNDNMSTTRTYIQCTAAISRQAGHRIGESDSFGTPASVLGCWILTFAAAKLLCVSVCRRVSGEDHSSGSEVL